MFDVGELRQRYETVKVIENSKDNVIEELFAKIQQLQCFLEQEEEELKDQKRLVRDWKEDCKKSQDELRKLNENQARLSYVSVLIDGDGMNFLNRFVAAGKSGGQEAAKALKEAVQNHVQEVEPNAGSNVQYKIRVYANVKGLAKTYHRANIITSEGILESFIQGFNMENMLCDFVDVGKAKESSDAKIRGLFEIDLIDVHCLRIIFGGSGDNGYVHMLRPHRGSDRISLIEGPPFERDLKALTDEFKTTSFENVFRPTKLPSSSPGVSFSEASRVSTTPPPNYASMARSVPQPQSETSDGYVITNGIPGSLRVCRNAQGQRVDRLLRFSSKGKLEVLKKHKFCNQFHILGSCNWGESCTHRHGRKLFDSDVIGLMLIARLSACPRGLRCDDERCVNGHCCPREGCEGNDCKFPKELHGIDNRIVAAV